MAVDEFTAAVESATPALQSVQLSSARDLSAHTLARAEICPSPTTYNRGFVGLQPALRL
jgi:hypothetical protein